MPPPFDRGEVPEKVRTHSPAPCRPLDRGCSALPAAPAPTSHRTPGPTPVRSPREPPPAGPPFPGAELRGKLPRAPGQTRWTPPSRGPSGAPGRARHAGSRGSAEPGARPRPSAPLAAAPPRLEPAPARARFPPRPPRPRPPRRLRLPLLSPPPRAARPAARCSAAAVLPSPDFLACPPPAPLPCLPAPALRRLECHPVLV